MRRIAYALASAALTLSALTACGGRGGSQAATAAPSTPGSPAAPPATAVASPAGSTPAAVGAHPISFGERAGGLARDHAAEAANRALLHGLTTTPAMSRYGVGKLQGAIYGPPYAAGANELIKLGPEQFLVAAAGVTLDDPKTALADVLKSSTSTAAGGTLTDTNPGPLGGAASCLSLTTSGLKVNACYWADKTTFGSVTSFAKDVPQTAEQMRRIRADIEKPI